MRTQVKVCGITRVEDAELALTVARLNYTEAVYRYMVAKKRFEYAMGH